MSKKEVSVTPMGEMIDYIRCYRILKGLDKQRHRYLVDVDEELFPNIK